MVLLALAAAWLRSKETTSNSAETITVSVIIPFRNEKENLPTLISCLKNQTYQSKNIEYLFIDDNSEDGGEDLLRNHSDFRLILSAGNEGKKQTLHAGIMQAKNDWIVTLDADVSVGVNWMKSIVNGIHALQGDMIILPMSIQEEPGIFNKIQCLEFISIIGITAGSAILKTPILCNGGNLAFRKTVYHEAYHSRKDMRISSGDDIFLMHTLKKNHRISWLHNRDAIALTAPCKTISEFFHQRIRWASKSNKYRDNATILFGALVYATNVGLLLYFILALLNYISFESFAVAFITKLVADFLLTIPICRWLGKVHLLLYFPLLSILYPVYLLLIGIGSIFFIPKWKGRRISLSHSNVRKA